MPYPQRCVGRMFIYIAVSLYMLQVPRPVTETHWPVRRQPIHISSEQFTADLNTILRIGLVFFLNTMTKVLPTI